MTEQMRSHRIPDSDERCPASDLTVEALKALAGGLTEERKTIWGGEYSDEAVGQQRRFVTRWERDDA